MAKVKSIQEVELENRVLIEDYYNKYVFPLKNGLLPLSDLNMKSICPFHSENDPSFHYWKSRKRFHCFGCGVSGNVVRLHVLTQKMYHGRNISHEEAINELIGLYNLQEVIKSVEVDGSQKTAFELARESLFDTSQYMIAADTFTISKFRKMNDTIIESDAPLYVKLKEFEELDMLAGLVCNQHVNN
jgi:hypothetical protein